MYCKKCGTYIAEEGKFCPQCGTPVKRPDKIKPALIALTVIALIGATFVLALLFHKPEAPKELNALGAKEKREAESADTETLHTDPETYYEEYADVVSVVSADRSPRTVSEQTAEEDMIDRGFDIFPVTYEYSIEGDYLGGTETDDSGTKHPYYTTYYLSSEGEIWTVNNTNGTVTAYPASYNAGRVDAIPVILSETQTIVSYDSAENTFYETIPSEKALILIIVPVINAETLENMTGEKIDAMRK